MTEYFLRRLLGLLPTLFVIVTLSFFIIRIAPGGPFDTERVLPEQIMRNIEAKYHLDEPILKQYGRYVLDILRGDLGPSYRYADRGVSEFLFSSLPDSMLLAVMALSLALTIGIVTGMAAAYFQNTWADYCIMIIAIIGISVPLFVLGPTLMYFFSLQWDLLPTSGWITGPHGGRTLILPIITLSAYYIAYIARLSRASTIDVLQSDFIRTARAKGLGTFTIMLRHVLKGALLPVASYIGPTFAALITGSVIVESIFRIPGIGKFFIQSAFNRDYTMIMGTVIIYSTILIIMNFVVDVIYGVLDPRVSYK